VTPLEWALVGFATALGLIIGSFLNVVISRVPTGESLRTPSHCPNCQAPIRAHQNVPLVSWIALRRKCAKCQATISARYILVEFVTALAFGGVAIGVILQSQQHGIPVISASLVFIAYAYLAAISIALAVIDIDTGRLPDAITLPAYPVMIVALGAASIPIANWDGLLRAVIGGVALWAFYALLRLIRPDGMGGGDVKLAGVLGAALGYLGWGHLVVGAFAAFIFGGLFGLALLLTRKAGRKTEVPFGPWMLAGAWTGIIFGGHIADWYVGMLNV
jgi:leader peptidase (prepilin peptidase)/N-methyltransferase